MSPCNVVCSKCGGLGYRDFLVPQPVLPLSYYITPKNLEWKREECQNCSRKGHTSEKTFEEREILFRKF